MVLTSQPLLDKVLTMPLEFPNVCLCSPSTLFKPFLFQHSTNLSQYFRRLWLIILLFMLFYILSQIIAVWAAVSPVPMLVVHERWTDLNHIWSSHFLGHYGYCGHVEFNFSLISKCPLEVLSSAELTCSISYFRYFLINSNCTKMLCLIDETLLISGFVHT